MPLEPEGFVKWENARELGIVSLWDKFQEQEGTKGHGGTSRHPRALQPGLGNFYPKFSSPLRMEKEEEKDIPAPSKSWESWEFPKAVWDPASPREHSGCGNHGKSIPKSPPGEEIP